MKTLTSLLLMILLGVAPVWPQGVVQTTNDKGTLVTIIGANQSQAERIAGVAPAQQDGGFMTMTSGGQHHYNVSRTTSTSAQPQSQRSQVRVIGPQPAPAGGNTFQVPPGMGWTGDYAYDTGGGVSYVVRPSAKTRLSSLYGDFGTDDFDARQWRQAARRAERSQTLNSTRAIREAKGQNP